MSKPEKQKGDFKSKTELFRATHKLDKSEAKSAIAKTDTIEQALYIAIFSTTVGSN